MPMYARGYVTYGTVIATLVATLGDAAFVLIGAVFQDSSYLTPVIVVHATSFVVGVLWGYGVDSIEVTPTTPLGRLGPKFGTDEPLGEEVTKAMEGKDSLIENLPREIPEAGVMCLTPRLQNPWVTAVGLCLQSYQLHAQDPEYHLS